MYKAISTLAIFALACNASIESDDGSVQTDDAFDLERSDAASGDDGDTLDVEGASAAYGDGPGPVDYDEVAFSTVTVRPGEYVMTIGAVTNACGGWLKEGEQFMVTVHWDPAAGKSMVWGYVTLTEDGSSITGYGERSLELEEPACEIVEYVDMVGVASETGDWSASIQELHEFTSACDPGEFDVTCDNAYEASFTFLEPELDPAS